MIIQGDLFGDDWRARATAASRRDGRTARNVERRHLRLPPRFGLTRRRLIKALAMIILGQFLYAAILGPNGLARWSAVHAQRTEHAALLARLEAERGRLVNHVRLLDPARADVDLVDELIRRDLGFARPDEIVLSH